MGHIDTIIYIIYFNSKEPILFDIPKTKAKHVRNKESNQINTHTCAQFQTNPNVILRSLIICILSVSNCSSTKHCYIPLCGELITCILEST